ncbi:hypothetical protein DL766_009223 [Monosporascus sp. MC13-8B]|uniref:Uncharacterized protein n=1 Tax=Monosporascus cannonballus TaxID=155416 RepID=A0ABY0HF39_9PEZI|nr:hypothetical protein DL762_002099 [Monosporascus cannonballus]RYP16094.1 hypothetical protein DL766_009223 [Monosporascus sp. MC13-8B]
MLVPNISLLLLGIACIFGKGYDITKPLRPKGPLGVTLDYSLATSWPEPRDPKDSSVARNWVWTSHLQFKNPVSEITDRQIWQIARDAWDKVQVDMKQYDIGRRHGPRAMSVLAWGNEIILASSQRGMSSFSYGYKGTPVLETLELCQITWREDGPGGGETDKEHKNEGKCGELMAAHLYYSQDARITLARQNARIGTALRQPNGLVNTDPCGEPEKVSKNRRPPSKVEFNKRDLTYRKDIWGCNLFVKREGLIVLDKNLTPEPYDLSTLAGGVVVSNQIQLCAVIRRF